MFDICSKGSAALARGMAKRSIDERCLGAEPDRQEPFWLNVWVTYVCTGELSLIPVALSAQLSHDWLARPDMR